MSTHQNLAQKSHCPHCQSVVGSAAQFCGQCGKPIATPPAISAAPTLKSNLKWRQVGIAAALVGIVALSVARAVLRHNHQSPAKVTSAQPIATPEPTLLSTSAPAVVPQVEPMDWPTPASGEVVYSAPYHAYDTPRGSTGTRRVAKPTPTPQRRVERRVQRQPQSAKPQVTIKPRAVTRLQQPTFPQQVRKYATGPQSPREWIHVLSNAVLQADDPRELAELELALFFIRDDLQTQRQRNHWQLLKSGEAVNVGIFISNLERIEMAAAAKQQAWQNQGGPLEQSQLMRMHMLLDAAKSFYLTDAERAARAPAQNTQRRQMRQRTRDYAREDARINREGR